MFRVKRVYEPAAKDDGWRVLVDRLWPRGLTKQAAKVDVWQKEISPSNELRKWYSHDLKKWPEFQKRYRAEIAKHKEAFAELKAMEKEHGTVTLLYGSKNTTHNQAIALVKFLKG
jgi:uncharacterized protein YeaO (DUF488 family)